MGKNLVLFPIVLYGLWAFFLKIAAGKLHPFQISLISSCVAIVILPLYVWVLSNKVQQPFNAAGIFWTVAASLSSITAALIYMYIIRTGEVSIFSALISTSPVVTVLLAAIFLGEQITGAKIIGVLLIVFGVMFLR